MLVFQLDIPAGIGCEIDTHSFDAPPVFTRLRALSGLGDEKLFNTFNMGVGMSVVVAKEDEAVALASLKESGLDAYVIGEIAESDDKVKLV